MTMTEHDTNFAVPAAPAYGLRARVAKTLVEKVVAGTPVRVRYPDGREIGAGGPRSGVLELHQPEAFFARMGADPKVGLGESFMAGEWSVAEGDLAELLAPFAARLTTMLPGWLLNLRRVVVDRALPSVQRNTLGGSRANIAAHYDLSNEMFALFLDETMTYSSALFDEALPFAEQDLVAAQRRKIDAILDAAGVGPGSKVLEIGTGWGELALRAGGRGADVTTITLSTQQRELALQRVAAAGVSDRVTILLSDYREVEGSFDAIVSVEMIEAVGEEFWPTYFSVIDQLLAPGGTAAIQAIVMDHDRLLATRNSFGWIQKYIFPGGLIPSLHAIREVTGAHTSLHVAQVHAFGLHYAETLRRWRERFLSQWAAVEEQGFDETFRRMWEFYLAYCEAGFAVGYLDVAHVSLRRS